MPETNNLTYQKNALPQANHPDLNSKEPEINHWRSLRMLLWVNSWVKNCRGQEELIIGVRVRVRVKVHRFWSTEPANKDPTTATWPIKASLKFKKEYLNKTCMWWLILRSRLRGLQKRCHIIIRISNSTTAHWETTTSLSIKARFIKCLVTLWVAEATRSSRDWWHIKVLCRKEPEAWALASLLQDAAVEQLLQLQETHPQEAPRWWALNHTTSFQWRE